MDVNRLYYQLNNTGLATKNNPLYQLLNQMLQVLSKLSAGTSSGGSSSTTVENITNNFLTQILEGGSDSNGDDGGTIIIQQSNVPGPPGPKGDPGQSGAVLALEEYIETDVYPIPGPVGPKGNTGSGGKVVQVVETETGAVSTGTGIIPHDDTIPQNIEGNEFMTLSITPTSATNKLKIEVVTFISATNVSQWLTSALFQDTTANALAAGTVFDATATAIQCIVFTHWMTAGTTSLTTFKVRCGRDVAGTTTFNGQSGGRIFGGVMASSITITEVAP